MMHKIIIIFIAAIFLTSCGFPTDEYRECQIDQKVDIAVYGDEHTLQECIEYCLAHPSCTIRSNEEEVFSSSYNAAGCVDLCR